MSSVKLRKEKDCLNCGHLVEDHFCPHCGQENIIVKEDAFHMVAHAIADYFHFEHKFFGTIGPLLLKPGQLTKEYVAGKRMSFIHPIRLYIFISIVFFLVILSGRNHEEKKAEPKKEINHTELTATEKEEIIADQTEGIRTAMKYIPIDQQKKDSIIKVAEDDIRKKGKTDINLYTGQKKQRWGGNWATNDTTVTDYEKKQAALPTNKRDGFLKHYIAKRSIELNKYPDPEKKFWEDFLHNLPKGMFLLLPLFALILKLVYINKNRYYYEHLIYSFHVHSAIFLSVLITILLRWIFHFFYNIDNMLSFLCLIYMIWYIYRSLRTFYGSSRWVTILKVFFLNICYSILLSISILLIMAASFVMI